MIVTHISEVVMISSDLSWFVISTFILFFLSLDIVMLSSGVRIYWRIFALSRYISLNFLICFTATSTHLQKFYIAYFIVGNIKIITLNATICWKLEIELLVWVMIWECFSRFSNMIFWNILAIRMRIWMLLFYFIFLIGWTCLD